jgi:hypothetical protein
MKGETMPRITETLTEEIKTASRHFDNSNDRFGGITLDLVSARALVEIADSLKGIQAALEPIAKKFEAGELPIKLASPELVEASPELAEASPELVEGKPDIPSPSKARPAAKKGS